MRNSRLLRRSVFLDSKQLRIGRATEKKACEGPASTWQEAYGHRLANGIPGRGGVSAVPRGEEISTWRRSGKIEKRK
jgi:hypothetical protein